MRINGELGGINTITKVKQYISMKEYRQILSLVISALISFGAINANAEKFCLKEDQYACTYTGYNEFKTPLRLT